MPGHHILDLGTGTGELALQFASQGSKVIGIDSSEKQIEAAACNAGSRNLNIEFLVEAAEDISFVENQFDIVSASMCFYYFDLKILIPKIKSILKPDGEDSCVQRSECKPFKR